jgi:GNAT superfamily N-acetyltransferase
MGPMAVLPNYQSRGIGTKLIEAGNRNSKMRAAHLLLSWAAWTTIGDLSQCSLQSADHSDKEHAKREATAVRHEDRFTFPITRIGDIRGE